jgi:quinol monooxygenase YgiN
MIIVLTEMAYPAGSDDRMRSVVPAVEQFCQAFDGCERFALSFPADRPGVLLATEIWQTPVLLREHVGVARDAPELKEWHDLLTGTKHEVFSAEPVDVAQLMAGGDPHD